VDKTAKKIYFKSIENKKIFSNEIPGLPDAWGIEKVNGTQLLKIIILQIANLF
jgi:hypothetical protein